ncbi:glycosyltransferase family 2 protein [Pelagibaculum spongiae]|nr:glycosyltransferase family 2 protein [Pelagibaculum spongiae]
MKFNLNRYFDSRDYQSWLGLQSDSKKKSVEFNVSSSSIRPVFSILVPVYKVNSKFLEVMLKSVLSQSYSEWQLCIVDDGSSDKRIHDVIKKYQNNSSKIYSILSNDNQGISSASNKCLSLAHGDYIVLLDHDDVLHSDALLFLADAIIKNPKSKIIYTDEDKIDKEGRRYSPHFKPDFNYDLLLSQNYICHLTCYKTNLVVGVGGFRQGFEGSQDYDLLLRCISKINPNQIVHIPEVLYHWRACSGSTALEHSAKNYTTAAGIKSLIRHFSASPEVSIKKGMLPNTYQVRWPILGSQPSVALIVPTRDGFQILKQCIDNILSKTHYQNYQIVVVDNQSSCKKTLSYLKKISCYEKIRVVKFNKPFNYSEINNFAVDLVDSELIGLVNNDTEVISKDWLNEMVSHAIRPDIGCVGAKLYYPDNTIQHAGVILGIAGYAGHAHKHYPKNKSGYFSRLKLIQNFSAVTGACLLVRRKTYLEVGGLDQDNLKVALSDIDFCLKVREAGYRNLWTPYAELYHHESKSRGAEDTPEKQQRFEKEVEFMKEKWGDALNNDPAYNPNLTLKHEDFRIGNPTC